MRLSTRLLALSILGLALGGCGASQAHDSSIDLSDPSWTPPGQGDLAVGADPEPKAKPKPRKPRHLEQPNKREIPTQGALRAQNP
jgi:hypothetical protein